MHNAISIELDGTAFPPNAVPRQPFKTYPGVPIIPPLPQPGPYSEYAAKCGECGILIPKGAWGYCCPNNRCPIQPKVTM